MAEKIQTNADLSPQSTPLYDDQIKLLVAEWLEFEIVSRKDKGTSTIADEKIAELNQRRFLGKIIAGSGGITAFAILFFLAYQMIMPGSVFCKMEPIPQAVFISASFLSFIVIYATLIKGLFYKSKDEADISPIKEATDMLAQFRSGE